MRTGIRWTIVAIVAVLTWVGMPYAGAQDGSADGENGAAGMTVPAPEDAVGETSITVTSVQIGASWSAEQPDDRCWVAVRGSMPNLDRDTYVGYHRNPRITAATGPDGEAIALPEWSMDPEGFAPLPRRSDLDVYISLSEMASLPTSFGTMTGVVYAIAQTESATAELDLSAEGNESTPTPGLTMRVESVDTSDDSRISVTIGYIRTDEAEGVVAALPIADFAEIRCLDQDNARLSQARTPEMLGESQGVTRVQYFFYREFDQVPTTMRLRVPTAIEMAPLSFTLEGIRLPEVR